MALTSDRSPSSWKGRLAAVLAVVAVAVFACIRVNGNGPAPLLMEASGRLPHETLADVRTYADGAAIIEVRSARDGVPEDLTSSVLIPRVITVEVERWLWSRPGVAPLPHRFTWDDFGWVEKDGTRRPVKSADAPRFEIGHRYYVPLARYADGKVEALAGDAVLEVRDGRIVPEDDDDVRPFAAQFRGRSPDEVAELIRRARPIRGSQKFMDLDPVARFNALAESEHDGG